MGTLNPYREPFLGGNWIINIENTISVIFQLKLILEMFLFIFTRETLLHRGYSTPSSALNV